MSVTKDNKLWTSHINIEDVPFINTGVPGMEMRLLHYREDEEMSATQLRAAPFTVSGKHVHLAPAHAYTIAGSWGHDHNYEYVRGTYIFEPIGVVHQFFSGPEPVDAFFVAYGESQWIDEETGEVGGSIGIAAQVAHYFQQCEEQGLPRPNILRA
jgi:quercetin dioxygenase-like cupin family protein